MLSLSGGGYKGVYSLSALKSLEDAKHSLLDGSKGEGLRLPIQECCDAFLGTSVGAIIATGLAIGKSPADLLEIFLKEGSEIFPGEAGIGIGKARYSTKAIEKIIREIMGDRTFQDVEKPCFVSTVDAETGMPLLVGGWKGADIHFANTPIWEAVLASVSAPTYFPFRRFEFPLGDNENPDSNGWLVDGGLSANAPELIALSDLSKNFAVPLDNFFVLSIGTTSTLTKLDGPRIGRSKTKVWTDLLKPSLHWKSLKHFCLEAYIKALNHPTQGRRWGAIAWFVNGRTSLIELILKSQENAAVRVCGSIVPSEQYIRLDTHLPYEDRIELDDPRKHSALVKLGEKVVENELSPSSNVSHRIALFTGRRFNSHSAVVETLSLGN